MSDLINKLSELRSQYSCFDGDERGVYHTLSEAIEALLAKDINVPSNGDVISRQAVIDRINKQREHLNPSEDFRDLIGDSAYKTCIEFIERLPSAQKTTGHWIIFPPCFEEICMCSNCKTKFKEAYQHRDTCPSCGAKMEVEE